MHKELPLYALDDFYPLMIAPETRAALHPPQTKIAPILRVSFSAAACAKAWEYTDKAIVLTGYLISIIIKTGRQISNQVLHRLSRAALHLRLFSIINIPLNLASMSALIQSIGRSLIRKEHGNTVYSTASFCLLVGETFDLVTDFVNATLAMLTRKPIAWISSIGIPLGLATTGLNISFKSMRLHELSKFQKEFEEEIILKLSKKPALDLIALLEPFLEKHLDKESGAGEPSAKALLLEHKTTPQIAALMHKIAVSLKNNPRLTPNQHNEVLRDLKYIQELLKKEKKLQPLSLSANVISGIGLSLFLSPISAAIPFAILAGSTAFQLGIKIHEDRPIVSTSPV